MNNIAVLLSDQEQYNEAEILYEKVSIGFFKALGPEHVETKRAKNNLLLLQKKKRNMLNNCTSNNRIIDYDNDKIDNGNDNKTNNSNDNNNKSDNDNNNTNKRKAVQQGIILREREQAEHGEIVEKEIRTPSPAKRYKR